MNIIKALESNRRYRQKGSDTWLIPNGTYIYTREELIADNWEVEERKVEVTEDQIREAVKRANRLVPSWEANRQHEDAIVKELGLIG